MRRVRTRPPGQVRGHNAACRDTPAPDTPNAATDTTADTTTDTTADAKTDTKTDAKTDTACDPATTKSHAYHRHTPDDHAGPQPAAAAAAANVSDTGASNDNSIAHPSHATRTASSLDAPARQRHQLYARGTAHRGIPPQHDHRHPWHHSGCGHPSTDQHSRQRTGYGWCEGAGGRRQGKQR